MIQCQKCYVDNNAQSYNKLCESIKHYEGTKFAYFYPYSGAVPYTQNVPQIFHIIGEHIFELWSFIIFVVNNCMSMGFISSMWAQKGSLKLSQNKKFAEYAFVNEPVNCLC